MDSGKKKFLKSFAILSSGRQIAMTSPPKYLEYVLFEDQEKAQKRDQYENRARQADAFRDTHTRQKRDVAP